MKFYPLIAGILILLLLAAGCSEDAGPDTATPEPTTASTGALYMAGDIAAKTATQPQPLWLVIKYDQVTDKYERALIYKKSDGSWGYRKDNRTELSDRATMEKVYPVKITHVTVSTIPIISSTPSTTVTTTTAASLGPAPEITSITPNTGAMGSSVSVSSLAGNNFVSGATVKLIGANGYTIAATDVLAIDTKITCIINLNTAIAGKYDVVVTNPDGRLALLTGGFTITEAAPVVTAIDPAGGKAGETVTLAVSGHNFKTPAKVYFDYNGAELEGANVEVKSASQITLVLGIPSNAPLGEWDVIVRNVADKQNGTALNMFTISNST
ncbi:MAG: IPT/TIG domain protein [Methanoregula sp. PtaU1.Bin051]|nr:MAG: IPT/TIG domain protein [Methanoregula sp. PtaU1.Bin051]